MNELINAKLRVSVAQVVEANTDKVLGTCFPITATGILVTCFHVIGNCDTGAISNNQFVIYWPQLDVKKQAVVSKNSSLPDSDLAFLKITDNSLPTNVDIFTIDLRIIPKSKFVSFGYRKSENFQGLFNGGEIVGEITHNSGLKLIQIRTNEIGRGMSGAPVIDENYKRVVGIISDFWKSKSLQDRDLAFAIPSREILVGVPDIAPLIPGMVAQPKTETMPLQKAGFSELFAMREHISKVFNAAAILLLSDQFKDGAWARTLWRWSGKPFTKDILPNGEVQKTKVKKAISITSWAGQSLFKATGNNRLHCLLRAKNYLASQWNETHKAFGYLYNPRIETPMIGSSKIFISNPRHTASAAKYLEMIDGLSPIVIDSISFIVESEHKHKGGWGETPDDEANTLTTAFIIDSLAKISQADNLSKFLPKHIYRRLTPCITRGMAWLAEQQDIKNGCWIYGNNYELRPFYTIHILVFTPQIVHEYSEVGESAIQAVLSQKKAGGIPTSINGEPQISASAMFAYALSKIDPNKYRNEIISNFKYVISEFLKVKTLSNYHIYDSIFALMLTQLPFIDRTWWQNDLYELVTSVESVLNMEITWEQMIEEIRSISQVKGIDITPALTVISESPRE